MRLRMNNQRWWAIGFVLAGLLWFGMCSLAHALTIVRPPLEYQHDATIRVTFEAPAKTEQRCAALTGNPSAISCAQIGTAMMPNPCVYNDDLYAQMMCHELGHANGMAPE